ncbi:MAG TPA: amino acid adenylation domain-containing protein, partial [Candidatus Binatia bacterium]
MSEFDESNLPPRQLQVWIAQKLLSNQAVYNLPIALTISGNIDPVSFQRAFQTLVNSSDALRMIFEEVRGIPIRRVMPEMGYDLPFLDFSTRPDPTAAAQSWLRENAIKTFDLGHRLFEAALLKVSADEFVWYLNMHHLIGDAWSVQLIYQSMAQLYAGATDGNLPNKIVLNSFEAVSAVEGREGHLPRASKAEAYWKRKLSGDSEPLRFYGTAANKAGTRVTRKVYDLGRERSEMLKRVIREIDHRDSRDDALLLNAFYAVLCAYLARFHDQWNCFVGMASHNRRGSLSKQTIGFFSEVLPVRMSVHEEDSFAFLARKINAEVFETVRHGNFAVTDPVRGPVYDVVLNYHKAAFNDFGGMPARPEWIHTGHGFESFMLQVHDFSSAGRLLLSFDLHDEIFSEQQAEMAIRHFLAVLDAMAASPNRPIARLDLVSPDDLRLLLCEWNATETAASTGRCVNAAFEEQAEKNSAAAAVVSGNETLSYGDLNRRANRLARCIKRFGVGPNSLVGIYLDRSVEMIVAILAVLKAGGAYVPIDPNSPVDRVAFVIKDTGLSLMLTCRGLVEKLPQRTAEVICLDSAGEKISHESDQNLGGRPRKEDLAYVIYTSGSTGDPKGVEISHGALANFSSWAIEAYQLSPSDRVLQFAAVGFDAAIEEIFPTLLGGGTLVLRTERSIASIQAFVDHCRDWQISVVDLPTSYWHELTRTLCRESTTLPESIRLVIIGGESASPKSLAEWRQIASRGCRLVNTYGPTEATVVATACDLTDADDTAATSEPVPIGRPIANARVYVLDRRLEPVPIGVAGELFIAGAGLAAGYRNSPALTARNFITKSFGYGLEERLYRTGDIVRYRRDGRLEFLGRSDDQLKIMGYRVEPKEIESTLAQYPGVKEAIATPFSSENDERRIAAYVVPQAGANVTADELRAYLSRKLPAYMIPAAIV